MSNRRYALYRIIDTIADVTIVIGSLVALYVFADWVRG